MVKKTLKAFLYIILFFVFLIFFAPKTNLYYFAEKQLQNYAIIIDNETIKEHTFSLEISHPTLYIKSIQSAKAMEVDIKPFILYNAINISNIRLTQIAKNFFPTKIDYIDVKWTVFNPIKVSLHAKGEFGEAKGYLDLIKKAIYITIKPSKLLKSSYSQLLYGLKQNKNKEYIYESNL